MLIFCDSMILNLKIACSSSSRNIKPPKGTQSAEYSKVGILFVVLQQMLLKLPIASPEFSFHYKKMSLVLAWKKNANA